MAVTPPAFVLDGSVALAWYFADEQDAYADAVGLALPGTAAVVPALWHWEIANTLVVGERRGRSTEAQATAFLARLAGQPVVTDPDAAGHAWAETIRLARAHNLSAYDAAYLELAVRLSLPLATLDARLKAAAKAAGVSVYPPP